MHAFTTVLTLAADAVIQTDDWPGLFIIHAEHRENNSLVKFNVSLLPSRVNSSISYLFLVHETVEIICPAGIQWAIQT